VQRHFVRRRIPQADAWIDAADLDLAQLRVRDLAPWADRATGIPVAVPRADPDHVVARQVRVIVDESLLGDTDEISPASEPEVSERIAPAGA